MIASIFGTCSPIVMWSEVASVKAIANEIAGGDAVAERPVDRGLDQVGERGLAEEADPDRGQRDPDLAGGQDSSICSSWCERLLGAGLALLGERLDPPAPRSNERELGSDEQAVEEDEHDQQDEEERRHCFAGGSGRVGPVLRGRSSSMADGQTVAAG